jgi:hypothetical protein
MARNGHNFASLVDKPDWRKCATFAPEPTLGPFSLKSPLHSPVSKTPSGECNAITKRCCGEGDLTSWKWKILPFHPPSWAATLNGDTIGKGVRSNRTVWVVTSTVGVVGPGWIRTILKFDVLPSPRPCGGDFFDLKTIFLFTLCTTRRCFYASRFNHRWTPSRRHNAAGCVVA